MVRVQQHILWHVLTIGVLNKFYHFWDIYIWYADMKNFNRRNSCGHHGSKRHELAPHEHSHGSHAFTNTLTSTQLQPRGVKHQLSYYFSVHAGTFCVSVIHQTLTWTTGSLTCVHDHSCAWVYTHRSWAHWHRVSTTFLTRLEKKVFLVLLTGFEPSSFGSWVWCFANWATPCPVMINWYTSKKIDTDIDF